MTSTLVGKTLGVGALSVLLLLGSIQASLAADLPCRVRNMTQDTTGGSLIRMVERAEDGDELRVRGRCSGPVLIEADLSIVGRGDSPTLTGRDRLRVLRTRGASVSLTGLTIEHGATSVGGGGGIDMRGGATVELVDSRVRRNTALYGAGICCRGTLHLLRTVVSANAGGGIYNVDGTVTVTDSTVRRNTANNGAGIVTSGTLTITGSTVSDNRSEDDGGGIANGGTLTITGSTVSDNRSEDEGGGIANGGTLTITGSTVKGNRARYGGGGIQNVAFRSDGILMLIDSTVRDNVARTQGGGGIRNSGGVVSLDHTRVRHNTAGTRGGGIQNIDGSISLDADSSVTGNTPDDCVGTSAC